MRLLLAVPEGIHKDLVVFDGYGAHSTIELESSLHNKLGQNTGSQDGEKN